MWGGLGGLSAGPSSARGTVVWPFTSYDPTVRKGLALFSFCLQGTGILRLCLGINSGA